MHLGRLRSLWAAPWVLLLVLWAVSYPAAQDVMPRCVTLSWTAPGDDGDVGTAALYDIRYSTSYLTEANWASAARALYVPTPEPAGTRQWVTVTNLEPATTYYIALKTADERMNWSEMSNVVARTTPPDICVGEVGNADCDPEEKIDIGDLTTLIRYLFIERESACICLTEANIDGDPDGVVDIFDLTLLIGVLFTSDPYLPPCP